MAILKSTYKPVYLTILSVFYLMKLTGQPIVHDPVMIKQDSTYYVFCTGRGVSVYSSTDMLNWKRERPVFDSTYLEWARKDIPGFKSHVWAPDIYFHNSKYFLYYSVSAFGKNTSCIGVATNPTLDQNNVAFKWTDHGKVVQSVPGRDLWNAIDPNLAFDEKGIPWLVFGSFWNGIKLVKLNDDLAAVAEPQEWYTIARRPRDFLLPDPDPGDGAIEAPFIFKKGKYYYLFVSFDYCCRGLKSNYKIMAGRSEKITGPYLDRDSVELNRGGGTLVLAGNESWPGIGHNSAYTFDGVDYIVFHGYDAHDDGKPKLLIRKLEWDETGWPMVIL